MNLLPQIKNIENKSGFLSKNYIAPYTEECDFRLKKAIDKLPCGESGVNLIINTNGTNSEKYILEINEDSIVITSDGLNGIFYGIQTLRQILRNDEIPCLKIEDEPYFKHRGFYHDVTRGKISTVEAVKRLIDIMAYFKMNSLQLYVEHVFEFEEAKEIIKKTGYITKEEIKEIDEYCYENFIEFIPSIATFGHMYELLEQEKYKHLRVCDNVNTPYNFWYSRMLHHTIDPKNEESFELVKSLIDQYIPLFRSDKFNICGDETFDVEEKYGGNSEAGKLYVDFITKVIDYVRSKNKKVMMWADILLKHPETIENMPDDICYLNWDYAPQPSEENIVKLSELGKEQIVCPGTAAWSRLCENVEREEANISAMVDYGYKHGAIGVLNTNWGDYGNPASLDLAMYGLVLGGVKSWTPETEINEEFYALVNALLYGGKNAMQFLKRISEAHSKTAPHWNGICLKYFEHRYNEKPQITPVFDTDKVCEVQRECMEIISELNSEKWEYDEAREEMILCAEGICVLAELGAKLFGQPAKKVADPEKWLKKYREKWLLKNKQSELAKIEEMILYINSL